MSERSLAILPALASLAERLNGRRPLLWLVAGGAAAAVLVAVLLATSSPSPEEVAVEVDLPPPPLSDPNAQPAPASPAAGADPATVRPGPGNAVSVPPVAADAFARIPLAPRAAPLPPAPDPALVEVTAEGALPRRGGDGRLPWQAYARPFATADARPRIGVIVTGLGPSAVVTREIIRRLPADVTLAFQPTAADAATWGREARAAGREIMLSLPVQGAAFPFVDRGPEALAGGVDAAENRARLHRLLARLAGYVGALADVGAEGAGNADAEASEALNLAGGELAERGLILVSSFLDRSKGGDVPQLGIDPAVEPDADVDTVRSRLVEAEAAATAKGYALIVVEPTPAAAEAVAAWAGTLAGKPVVLAPVSAVARAAQTNAR